MIFREENALEQLQDIFQSDKTTTEKESKKSAPKEKKKKGEESSRECSRARTNQGRFGTGRSLVEGGCVCVCVRVFEV